MYYNVYEGMQNTWYDRFGSVTDRVSSHNWLPAGVASLVLVWLGLLFMAIQPTISVNPGVPADLTATRNNPPMSVTTATNGGGELGVRDSDSSMMTVGSTSNVATTTTEASSSENPIAPMTDPIIGGRGADETPIVETPSVPTPAADVEVDTTPITSEPVTVGVDTDDGLQADVDAGGLLELDVDLDLGLLSL